MRSLEGCAAELVQRGPSPFEACSAALSRRSARTSG